MFDLDEDEDGMGDGDGVGRLGAVSVGSRGGRGGGCRVCTLRIKGGGAFGCLMERARVGRFFFDGLWGFGLG